MIKELKTAAGALFLILSFQMIVCIAVQGTSGEGKIQSESGVDSTDFFQMDSSGFFQQARVDDKIDLRHINHNLLSAAIFHETNKKRKEHGKAQLGHLPRLDEAARMHAQDMAENEYVAHVNQREQELRTPLKRVREVGLKNIRLVAENVASHFGIQYEPGRIVFPEKKDGDTEYYYQSGGKPIANHTFRSFAESLLGDWMNSPGHRKNILSEQPKFLGTGCSVDENDKSMAKFYCVQLFFDGFGY